MCLPDQHAWAYCVSSPGDKTVREKACSTLQTRGGKSAFGHDYGSWWQNSLVVAIRVGEFGLQSLSPWELLGMKSPALGLVCLHGSILNLQTFLLKRAPKMSRCSWKWLVLAEWFVCFTCHLAQLSGIWCDPNQRGVALTFPGAAATGLPCPVLPLSIPGPGSLPYAIQPWHLLSSASCKRKWGVFIYQVLCALFFLHLLLWKFWRIFFCSLLIYIVGTFISSPVFILKRGREPASPWGVIKLKGWWFDCEAHFHLPHSCSRWRTLQSMERGWINPTFTPRLPSPERRGWRREGGKTLLWVCSFKNCFL